MLVGSKNAAELRLEDPVEVRKLKVFYMEDVGFHPSASPVHRDLREAHRALARQFRDALGIEVRKVSMKVRDKWRRNLVFFLLLSLGALFGAHPSS